MEDGSEKSASTSSCKKKLREGGRKSEGEEESGERGL